MNSKTRHGASEDPRALFRQRYPIPLAAAPRLTGKSMHADDARMMESESKGQCSI